MMSSKRKRVAPPLFSDVEYNKGLNPKKRRCVFVCRICATQRSNDLIDIYGECGKNLKLSAKINKFLPIEIQESDGLSRWICFCCKTVLIKMGNLYQICKKTDAYFNEQMHNEDPTETEVVEEPDNIGEDLHFETTPNSPETLPTEHDNISTPGIVGFTVIENEPAVLHTYNLGLVDNEELNKSELPELFQFSTSEEGPTIEISSCPVINEDLGDSGTSEPKIPKSELIESFSISEEVPTVEISNTVDHEELVDSELPTSEHDDTDYLVTEDFVSDPEEDNPLAPCESTTTNSNCVEPTTTKAKNVQPTSTNSKTKSARRTMTKNKKVTTKLIKATGTRTKSGRQIKKVKKLEVEMNDHAVTAKKLPFKCDCCSQILKSSFSAESHYKSKHKMHLCTHCYQHYKTKNQLLGHCEKEHPMVDKEAKISVSSKLRCDLCDSKGMLKKHFRAHMKEKHQKFVCFKCLATFDDHSAYKEHLHQEKHGKICYVCGKEINGLRLAKIHMRRHHIPVKVVLSTGKENQKTVETTGIPVKISEVVYPIENNGSPSTQSKTLPFQCHFCEQKMTNSTEATLHYKQHKMHLCSFCFNHFPNDDELKEHQENSHTYSCTLCSYKIIAENANALKSHLDLQHKNVKSGSYVFECGVCNLRFKIRAELKNHMLEAHEKYICYVCLKCFNDQISYEGHLQIEDHYNHCKFCDLNFLDKNAVRSHLVQRHPKKVAEFDEQRKKNRQPFTCTICSKKFTALFPIKQHYLELHQKYFCYPCTLLFDSYSEIDTHSLEVHNCNVSWSHQCSVCGKYFELEQKLALHMEKEHKNMKPVERFYCANCEKSYSKKDKLREHILKIHEKIVPKGKTMVHCEFCNLNVRVGNLEKHKLRHKMFICIHCNSSFPSVHKLQMHFQMNHEVNVVKCPECQFQFEKNELEKHIEKEHNSEWTYICKMCNTNYKSDTEIWQHCTTEHGIIQDQTSSIPYLRTSPYQCKICHDYLANANKLKNHKHTIRNTTTLNSKSRMKVNCDLCGESYSKTLKAKHMYAKHNQPYLHQCDMCGRSFVTLTKKLNHVSRFHNYEKRKIICEICKFSFLNRTQLRRHQSTMHENNRELLPCPYCPRKFKGLSNFRKHMKVHVANMPYRCETCGLLFQSEATFTSHVQRHEQILSKEN